MAYCRNCGAQIDDQAVICVKCGVAPASGCTFCQNCGAPTHPNAVACTRCGSALISTGPPPVYPQPRYVMPAYPPVPREPGASAMAIVSFVLSLAGLVTCVSAVPGLILGIMEIKKINRGDSPPAGKGFAMAGAIIGGILTGLWVLLIMFYIFVIVISIAAS